MTLEKEIEAILDDKDKPKIDIMDVIEKKAQVFAKVFESEDGKYVMDQLEQEFERRQLADVENVNKTFYRLGGRDVLQYIRLLIQQAKKGDKK